MSRSYFTGMTISDAVIANEASAEPLDHADLARELGVVPQRVYEAASRLRRVGRLRLSSKTRALGPITSSRPLRAARGKAVAP